MSSILPILVPVIAGALAMLAFEEWQKLWAWSATWPAIVKQVVVAALAAVLSKAVAAGIVLTGTDPTALGSADFQALISAGLAYIFHLGAKVAGVDTTAAPSAKVAAKK